ncbi:TetR/AcrR family transcriptional regulator [Streptomyces lunalinharesii]|uniref:TetR/AcrR family transcriptional regulator n=1 Tax=Streptomyces lunalinharesii TaxID=333384 RepID=A0ABN3SJN8_9ACTN
MTAHDDAHGDVHADVRADVHADVRTRILDAAERLFYARGIQAVGMDELRTAAGVSLKRLYGTFPAKHDLVEAYLRRRDARWRADLAVYVSARGDAGAGTDTGAGVGAGAGAAVAADAGAGTPEDRIRAVFDWLAAWFAAPDFHGCAFINAYGELGHTAEDVARATRDHKRALHAYLTDLVRPLNHPTPTVLATQLALLVDGAITAAAISGDPTSAAPAAAAAQVLVGASAASPS